MPKLSKIEEFKLYLLRYDMPLDPMMKLVQYCPDVLNLFSFDEIILIAPALASDLKPIQKTIIIPPVVYMAITLSAMRNKEGIHQHISNVLAEKTAEIIDKELGEKSKAIMRKITKLIK